MVKKQGHVFVRSRWVLCNKGDHKSPDMRARLVACEVNRGDKSDAFYASTPPLEAKTILFSRFAQERRRGNQPLRLDFLDVKKAYFNGIPKRDVYMQLPRELGLPAHYVGKQVRCVYGTRDAGAIWEDTYREALEGLGFNSGVASPCCFHHPQRGLSTVVHGDDITTLGCDKDLDWMREGLSKSFELKVRGRVGEGVEGSNDMRILNRVVEMTKTGITYESDPRHVDIVASSLGLTSANSVATPGVKEGTPDYNTPKDNEPQGTPSFAGTGIEEESIRRLSNQGHRKVNFADDAELHEVTPYSEIYTVHPSTIAATPNGFKFVSSRADPFTSKLGEIMKARSKKLADSRNSVYINGYRRLVLLHQNLQFDYRLVHIVGQYKDKYGHEHGHTVDDICIHALHSKDARRFAYDSTTQPPTFSHGYSLFHLTSTAPASQQTAVQGEPHRRTTGDGILRTPCTYDAVYNGMHAEAPTPCGAQGCSLGNTLKMLNAVKTSPKKKAGPARQGAKKAKQLERLQSTGLILNPEEATCFRALSARCNYLAQDRPDIAFASKELCREFAQPTKKSYERLKRLGRYLVGHNRLAYKYDFLEQIPEFIDVYVDTDFAGCTQTRRSTSGGVAMMGPHNVKHWAKT